MKNLEQYWKATITNPQGIVKKILFLFLQGLSIIYYVSWEFYLLFFKLKIKRPKKLSAAVISIGNLTLGGTGKTSLTLSLALELFSLGYKPAILLRGYGGKKENEICVVSDGKNIFCSAEDCGDEAYFLAHKAKSIPVIVGKNRFASGSLAVEKFSCNVIIIDDGFQYLELKKDLEIVLLDAKTLKSLKKIFPASIMRERLQNLIRADICILTRVSNVESAAIAKAKAKILKIKEIPIFYASNIPRYIYDFKSKEIISLDYLFNKKVLAFCGIGNPDSFFATVNELVSQDIKTLTFPDHYFFSVNDYKKINNLATGCDFIVTTEKDAQRIKAGVEFTKPLYIISAELEILKDKEIFNKIVKKAIKN